MYIIVDMHPNEVPNVYRNINMPHTDLFITTTQAPVIAYVHTSEGMKLNTNTHTAYSISHLAQLTIDTWYSSLIGILTKQNLLPYVEVLLILW